eukprot:COSAG05_NODE_785_length_7361_cov_460.024397_6_plen_156_part_00
MIRGKKHFLPPNPLVMGLAILFVLDESSIARHLGERRQGETEEDDACNLPSTAEDSHHPVEQIAEPKPEPEPEWEPEPEPELQPGPEPDPEPNEPERETDFTHNIGVENIESDTAEHDDESHLWEAFADTGTQKEGAASLTRLASLPGKLLPVLL